MRLPRETRAPAPELKLPKRYLARAAMMDAALVDALVKRRRQRLAGL